MNIYNKKVSRNFEILAGPMPTSMGPFPEEEKAKYLKDLLNRRKRYVKKSCPHCGKRHVFKD